MLSLRRTPELTEEGTFAEELITARQKGESGLNAT